MTEEEIRKALAALESRFFNAYASMGEGFEETWNYCLDFKDTWGIPSDRLDWLKVKLQAQT